MSTKSFVDANLHRVSSPHHANVAVFCYEPVEHWRACGTLDAMYKDLCAPVKSRRGAAILFQMQVVCTMGRLEHAAYARLGDTVPPDGNVHHIEGEIGAGKQFFEAALREEMTRRFVQPVPLPLPLPPPPRHTGTGALVMERSLFSSHCIFADMLAADGQYTDHERAVYGDCYPLWHVKLPNAGVPRSFLRIRPANLETCMDRLRMRSRCEETGVTIDYQRKLRAKHDAVFGAVDGYVAVLADHSLIRLCDAPTELAAGCCVRCTAYAAWPVVLRDAIARCRVQQNQAIRGVVPVHVLVVDEDAGEDADGFAAHVERAAAIIEHSFVCVKQTCPFEKNADVLDR